MSEQNDAVRLIVEPAESRNFCNTEENSATFEWLATMEFSQIKRRRAHACKTDPVSGSVQEQKNVELHLLQSFTLAGYLCEYDHCTITIW